MLCVDGVTPPVPSPAPSLCRLPQRPEEAIGSRAVGLSPEARPDATRLQQPHLPPGSMALTPPTTGWEMQRTALTTSHSVCARERRSRPLMGVERMAAATCRDRTSEFLAIAERLSKQQGKVGAPYPRDVAGPQASVTRAQGWSEESLCSSMCTTARRHRQTAGQRRARILPVA